MTIEHELIQRQILKDRAETLSVSFYEDGSITDPGTVTVGIADEAGNEIVASGTATSGTGADARTYDLAAQSDLNVLTVTWTSSTEGEFVSYVEIVGAHLFSIREARAFDTAVLASTSDYPLATIEEARARITEQFEQVFNVSFLPRYKRIDGLFGSGASALILSDYFVSSIRNVEYRDSTDTTWTEFASTDLDDLVVNNSGILQRRTRGIWTPSTEYRVTYDYGYSAPPAPIKRGALLLLTSYMGVMNSSWDPRATSMSTEAGVISLATPGRAGSSFGLPEVDALVPLYAMNTPVVG